jgi:hypothetical protein
MMKKRWSAPFVPQGFIWYMENAAGKDTWREYECGNNGVADDFAETFARTILYQSAPSSRMAWMLNYLASWR